MLKWLFYLYLCTVSTHTHTQTHYFLTVKRSNITAQSWLPLSLSNGGVETDHEECRAHLAAKAGTQHQQERN